MIQGDIVLIAFPFTDLTTKKVRPALVISKEGFNEHNEDAIFIMITSNTANLRNEDILLSSNGPGFHATGLRRESVVRTPKIHCLSQSLAKRRLGQVSQKIINEVLQKLRDLFFEGVPGTQN